MSAPAPVVRPARRGETDVAARLLTQAFADEAGLHYWLRQGGARDWSRALFFAAAVRGLIHRQRELWLAEAAGERLGAAIWLRPGDAAFQFEGVRAWLAGPFFTLLAGAAGSRRGDALGRALEPLHPPGPHAYLAFLGVAPRAQGRGVGAAMMKRLLAGWDHAGLVSHLECSTPRNVAFYARHGFTVSGEFEVPGLHMRAMTRPPGG